MPDKPEPSADDRPTEMPAVWFSVLERARRTNNPELTARAERELRRLGVRVSYDKPAQRRGTKS